MNIRDSSFRDWVLFLGPYLSWCVVASVIWHFIGKRTKRPTSRAITFGLLFAPAVIPIVREAYVIGSAPLLLLYLSVLLVVEPGNNPLLCADLLKMDIVAIFLIAVFYRIGLQLGKVKSKGTDAKE